jgi:hypothetical protein
MADSIFSREKLVPVVINGVAVLAFGAALTGWLHPKLGVLIMAGVPLYWLWEILTSQTVSGRISGRHRLLIGVMTIAVLATLFGPPAYRKLSTEEVKPPTKDEIAEVIAKNSPKLPDLSGIKESLDEINKNLAPKTIEPTKPDNKQVKQHRQKENKTEVALEFAGHDDLRVQMANTTDNAAEKPKWWFMMIDASNCFVWPEKLVWPEKPTGCQPLPLQTMTYNNDYINGMSRLGPYDVLSISREGIAKQHVKPGDEVVGQIAATCFNCSKMRRYYIYFKFGEGGWMYPILDAKNDSIKIPSGRLPNIPSPILKEFLQMQVPAEMRIQIPEDFDYKRETSGLP